MHITKLRLWLATSCKHATFLVMRQLHMQQPSMPLQPARVACSACRGWANLGEGCHIPDHVLLLDNVPHDWLLPQCSAVVHHGGAGTTAAGECFQLQPAATAYSLCTSGTLWVPSKAVEHFCFVASWFLPRQRLDLIAFQEACMVPLQPCCRLHSAASGAGHNLLVTAAR